LKDALVNDFQVPESGLNQALEPRDFKRVPAMRTEWLERNDPRSGFLANLHLLRVLVYAHEHICSFWFSQPALLTRQPDPGLLVVAGAENGGFNFSLSFAQAGSVPNTDWHDYSVVPWMT
jgi:hypothetical protein